MLVNEIMHQNPFTVQSTSTLCNAYKFMNEKHIRHLPVMEEETLVGIITDRDLRLATSRLATVPFEPTAMVKEIMISPVETTYPTNPVEVATQLMREKKIGCLPVMENEKLVGIVTAVDLLDALLHLTGVNRPSGRLEVRLGNKPGELARISNILSQRKINILSILTYPDKDDKARIVLRINTMEINSIASEICSENIEVIWPPHISCAK